MNKLFLQCSQCSKISEEIEQAATHTCSNKGQGLGGMLGGGKRSYSIVEQSE